MGAGARPDTRHGSLRHCLPSSLGLWQKNLTALFAFGAPGKGSENGETKFGKELKKGGKSKNIIK